MRLLFFSTSVARPPTLGWVWFVRGGAGLSECAQTVPRSCVDAESRLLEATAAHQDSQQPLILSTMSLAAHQVLSANTLGPVCPKIL